MVPAFADIRTLADSHTVWRPKPRASFLQIIESYRDGSFGLKQAAWAADDGAKVDLNAVGRGRHCRYLIYQPFLANDVHDFAIWEADLSFRLHIYDSRERSRLAKRRFPVDVSSITSNRSQTESYL